MSGRDGYDTGRRFAEAETLRAARALDEAELRGRRAAEGATFHAEHGIATDAAWMATARVTLGAPGFLTVRGGEERDRFNPDEARHGLSPSAPSMLYAFGEDGTGRRTLQHAASRVGSASTSYRLTGTSAAGELATLIADGIRFAARAEQHGASVVLVARPWSAYAGIPSDSESREIAHPVERLELGIDSRTT